MANKIAVWPGSPQRLCYLYQDLSAGHIDKRHKTTSIRRLVQMVRRREAATPAMALLPPRRALIWWNWAWR